jgi:YggT family protein
MSLLWAVLSFALSAFRVIMFIRLIVDMVRNANPTWRPKGLVLVAAELSMTITDPPLKFVRRFIRPIKIGALNFDLAWIVILLAVIFAQGYIPVA